MSGTAVAAAARASSTSSAVNSTCVEIGGVDCYILAYDWRGQTRVGSGDRGLVNRHLERTVQLI